MQIVHKDDSKSIYFNIILWNVRGNVGAPGFIHNWGNEILFDHLIFVASQDFID
jgi:hypothetical protein